MAGSNANPESAGRTKSTFKEALGELVEAPDPLLESVAAFHEGTMDDEERAAFATRLEEHSEARELLDELRAFERAEVDDGIDTASEFEVAATLRALRRREQEALRQREQAAPSSPSTAPARRAWVAAAALIVLSLGLGTAWLDTRRELMELRSDRSNQGFQTAQIHHLTGRELRSRDEPTPQIQGDAGRQILAVTPSLSLEAGQLVSCTITAAGSDDPLVGPIQIAATADGILLLSLESDLPSAGDYELHLRRPESDELMESLPFAWSPASP